MKVCRLAWDFPENGKPTYGLQPVFYYLSREQAKRGNDVHVISRREGSQPSLESVDGVTVHRLAGPFSLRAFRLVQELTKKEEDLSIIHTHSTCGLFLAALRKTIGSPIISHVHGTSVSAFMPVRLKFDNATLGYSRSKVAYNYARERALWSSADRILAVSRSVKSDLVSRYDMADHKIHVVYNGVDEKLFRPIDDAELPSLKNFTEGKRVVLYVGHFGLRKGLPFLIKAMEKVSAEVPDAILLAVGGVPRWLKKANPWPYLSSVIRTSGLQGKVFLLERVPNELLPSYYSRASVLVLPSYYEAFAKVVLEAMACAKPVVATRDGGPAEAIEDGQSGILVKYGSVREIGEAVIRVLQDNNLAREMGRRGRKTVLKDFTWTAVADRIDSAYSEAVQVRGKSISRD